MRVWNWTFTNPRVIGFKNVISIEPIPIPNCCINITAKSRYSIYCLFCKFIQLNCWNLFVMFSIHFSLSIRSALNVSYIYIYMQVHKYTDKHCRLYLHNDNDMKSYMNLIVSYVLCVSVSQLSSMAVNKTQFHSSFCVWFIQFVFIGLRLESENFHWLSVGISINYINFYALNSKINWN